MMNTSQSLDIYLCCSKTCIGQDGLLRTMSVPVLTMMTMMMMYFLLMRSRNLNLLSDTWRRLSDSQSVRSSQPDKEWTEPRCAKHLWPVRKGSTTTFKGRPASCLNLSHESSTLIN